MLRIVLLKSILQATHWKIMNQSIVFTSRPIFINPKVSKLSFDILIRLTLRERGFYKLTMLLMLRNVEINKAKTKSIFENIHGGQ